jgi:hypothetical protein
MTSSTLAARIATLTAHTHNLEVLRAETPVYTATMAARRDALSFEIAGLHALLDALNADYEEACDRELDAAFERA